MSDRRTYDLFNEPSGDTYRRLLRTLANLANRAGFILMYKELKPSGQRVLQALEPYLISIDDVNEWPGSRMAEGLTEVRYLYALTPESIDVLVEAADDLYSWANPDLPQDLHLLREDGSALLTIIAVEDEAWVELDDDEHAYLVGLVPELEEDGYLHRRRAD